MNGGKRFNDADETMKAMFITPDQPCYHFHLQLVTCGLLCSGPGANTATSPERVAAARWENFEAPPPPLLFLLGGARSRHRSRKEAEVKTIRQTPRQRACAHTRPLCGGGKINTNEGARFPTIRQAADGDQEEDVRFGEGTVARPRSFDSALDEEALAAKIGPE